MRISRTLLLHSLVTITMLMAKYPVSQAEQAAFSNAELIARLREVEKATVLRCATLPDLPRNPICRDALATANLAASPGTERRIAYVMRCSIEGRDCALDGTEDTLRKWLIGSPQPDARLKILYINDPKTGLTTAIMFWFKSFAVTP